MTLINRPFGLVDKPLRLLHGCEWHLLTYQGLGMLSSRVLQYYRVPLFPRRLGQVTLLSLANVLNPMNHRALKIWLRGCSGVITKT